MAVTTDRAYNAPTTYGVQWLEILQADKVTDVLDLFVVYIS